MGYSGKLEEKNIAIDLRKQGLSYGEIKRKVNVSKGTLSLWCRDIILTPEQLESLSKKKLVGSERGRFINSKRQQAKRIKETQELFEKGKREIGNLSDKEKFLVGIALYAAEGTKTDRQVVFSNSDPKLIKFMSNWLRKYCHADEDKLRGRLWIHENRNELKAKKFWSELTGIPENHFHKTYIAENKVNSKKIRKKVHEYGVFGIGISNTKMHRKIMGWIDGIMLN